jgi:hypothetical protein
MIWLQHNSENIENNRNKMRGKNNQGKLLRARKEGY